MLGVKRLAAAGLIVALGSLSAGHVSDTGSGAEPLVFSTTDQVTVSTSEVTTVTLLNNDPNDTYYLNDASALLYPPDDPTHPVTFLVGHGGAVPPASSAQLTMTATGAKAGSTGWLTVTAGPEKGRSTLVARLAIATASATAAKPVPSWSVTSTNDSATTDVPLVAGDCSTVPTTLGAVLVDGDRTVTVAGSQPPCTGKATSFALTFDSAHIGKYTGDLRVGDATVSLTYVRTLSLFWPLLMIVLGMLGALWVFARNDRAWVRDQRRWIKELTENAAAADATFVAKAAPGAEPGTVPPAWTNYRISTAATAERKDLGQTLRDITKRRGWIPRVIFPTGYKTQERNELLARIKKAEQTIDAWPDVPDRLVKLQQGITPTLFADAPTVKGLVHQVLAGTAPIETLDDVAAIEGLAQCWEPAAAAIQTLKTQQALLTDITHTYRWGTYDRDLLARSKATNNTLLALVGRSTTAKGIADLAPRIAALDEDVAGLPVPRQPTAPTEPAEPIESIDRMLYFALPAGVMTNNSALSLVTGTVSEVLGRVKAAASSVGAPLLSMLAVVLSLFVAVASGVPTLYSGQAWGSLADFVAAFVWGFTAAAVLTPITAALQRVGTRVADQPDPAKS